MSKNETELLTPKYPFYVGTYTHGESEGIYKYCMNSDGSLDSVGLAAKSESPSFLALSADGKYLVAANEVKNEDQQGSLESYRIMGDQLDFLSTKPSGGAHTCYVGIDEKGHVLAANYTGGNVALLQLGADGKFTDVFDVKQHEGKGTTDRQEGPHAHSIWFVPQSNEVVAVDLGTNELWFYTINDSAGTLEAMPQQKLAMADGAGPRHLAFHPNNKNLYVLNELNGTISQVAKNAAGVYEIIATFSTLPDDFVEFNKCADIHISHDGKFVYASNRGHNSIACFSVDERNGALIIVGFEPTKGDGPRNFSLSPDGEYLLVANQNSNNIVSFKRDATTGLLQFIAEIKAPTPVCVLFK